MLQVASAEGGGSGTGPADALARQWPRPDAGMDKHRGYALQWFSFAGIGLIVWVLLSLRRTGPKGANAGRSEDTKADGPEGLGKGVQ